MIADAAAVLRFAPALIAVFGLAIGSFLNVVVHRVPRRLSVVRPPSACPGCDGAISARDNVPVLSWLLLGGRCRSCRMAIPVRYPAVEALTAGAFVVVAIRFAPVDPVDGAALAAGLLALAAFLYLAAISVALAAIDLELHRLPNTIVLPGYAVAAVLLGTAGTLTGNVVALATAGIGAVASFGLYLGLAVARPGGMGMGDVKLAGVLGLFLGYLGPAPLLVGVFAAFLLGGIAGIVVLVARRGTRRTALPFGPWMLAGAWIGILAGEPLAAAYLSLAGLN